MHNPVSNSDLYIQIYTLIITTETCNSTGDCYHLIEPKIGVVSSATDLLTKSLRKNLFMNSAPPYGSIQLFIKFFLRRSYA